MPCQFHALTCIDTIHNVKCCCGDAHVEVDDHKFRVAPCGRLPVLFRPSGFSYQCQFDSSVACLPCPECQFLVRDPLRVTFGWRLEPTFASTDAMLLSAAMHWQLGLFVYLFLGKRDEAVLVLDLVSIVFLLTSAQASARACRARVSAAARSMLSSNAL